MKRILIGLGVVVGLLLIVAIVTPFFIDVNQYKPMIEAQAEKATGRKLTLEGDLSLSLLPSPSISVENVKLANDPRSADPEMLDVGRASVTVAWFPLPYISGAVNVTNVELEDTTIVFEQYADGTNNAPMPQTDVSDDDFLSEDAPDAGAEPTEAEAAGEEEAPLDIQIGSLSLNNIELIYRDKAAGSEERVMLDDVDISLGGLMGPFNGEGKIAARGLSVGFEIDVNELEPGRSLPVSVAITEEESDSKIGLSLSVLDVMTDPRVNGSIKVESDDLGGLAAFASGAKPASGRDKVDFLLESPIKASATEVALPEIAIRLGDESFDGAISATLGDAMAFDVALKSSTVDLDRLLTAVSAIGGSSAPAEEEAKTETASAEEAAPFEIPADLNGKIALDIGAMTYQGDAVQEVTFNASVANGQLRITKAGAKLPASTVASLDGTVRASNGAPLFTGNANLSTPDLRGLLNFAGVDVSSVPDGKLKVFKARLPIRATDSSVNVNGMSVNLDGSTLSGSLAAALGAVPKVTADLALDRINLDDYQGGAPTDVASSGGGSGSGDSEGGGASPFEADLALRVGTLTMSGTTLQNARVSAKVEGAADGSSTVAVNGSLGSTTIKADGRIADMADPIKAMTLNASISNPSARALAAPFAGILQGPPRFADGPVSYTVALKGDGGSLNTDFKATSNVGSLSLKGDVKDAMSDSPEFDMALAADAREFTTFFSSLALPYDPAGRKMGALTLRAKASGSTDKVRFDLSSFKIGEASITGTVDASGFADHPVIKANIEAGEVDLDKLMPRGEGGNEPAAQAQADATVRAPGTPPYTDEPIDVSGLRAADAELTMKAKYLKGQGLDFKDANFVFELKGGVARIKELSGKLYDGPIDMKATLDGSTDTPSLDVKYKLEQANFETASMALMHDDFITGTLSSEADVTGKGRTDRELAKSLNGFFHVFGERGKIKGMDLEALAKALGELTKGNFSGVQAAMSGGETEYKSLAVKFDIKDGVMTSNDAVVEVFSGKVTGKSIVDLPNWNQNSRIEARVATKEDVPPVAVIFTGPVDAPQRKIDLASLTTYAATSGLKNLFGGGKKKDGEDGEASEGEADSSPAGMMQQFMGGGSKEEAPATDGDETTTEEAPAEEEKSDPAAMMQNFFGGSKKTEEPAAEEPAAEEPAATEPAPAETEAEPVAEPAEAPAEEPAAEEPAAEEPAAEEPAEEQKPNPADALKSFFGN